MKQFLLLISILLLCQPVSASGNIKDLVRQLDETIRNRPVYKARKDSLIHELKQQLIHTTTDEQRYKIYGSLFDAYRPYNTDLSLVYAMHKQQIARRLNNPEYLDDANMNMAEVMGTTGMYMEGLTLLKSINRQTLAPHLYSYYYHLHRTIYGLMADYAVTPAEQKEYSRITDLYRDTLLTMHVADPVNYALVRADQLIEHGQADEAIETVLKVYSQPVDDNRSHSQLAYTLSQAYRLKGDTTKEKEYLLVSAISDIGQATKEYVSLRKLAQLVYDEGDVDRAYNYLKCSLEDATECNARLRTLEISQVFPIIDNAYQSKVSKQKQQLTLFLICVSILSFFLLLAVGYIYRQMKKIAVARREVIQANKQLKEMNEELNRSNFELKEMNHSLSEISHIKEEYIGRYMDQCSAYLEKMDNYRRSLGKLASGGKVDELYKAIKSTRFLDDELKEFYAGFDDTFLRLFPRFVDDFNELLNEKIYPKPGELLNTELRIFALIRLGITDSVKIAQFLRYSVTTIYNYRTRVRNKASGERDDFEAKVMKIGRISD